LARVRSISCACGVTRDRDRSIIRVWEENGSVARPARSVRVCLSPAG
jgi:hypothetical protein